MFLAFGIIAKILSLSLHYLGEGKGCFWETKGSLIRVINVLI